MGVLINFRYSLIARDTGSPRLIQIGMLRTADKADSLYCTGSSTMPLVPYGGSNFGGPFRP